jgi:hypothetical protein
MRLAVVLLVGCVGILHADSLRYSISADASGLLYQFQLANTGATGGTIFDLFLSFDTDIAAIDIGTIGTPVGWGDPAGGLVFAGPDVNPGTSFVEWAADGSGLYDLQIGGALSGFTITVPSIIGAPILYDLNELGSFSPAIEVADTPEPAGGWCVLVIAAYVLVRRDRLLRRV